MKKFLSSLIPIIGILIISLLIFGSYRYFKVNEKDQKKLANKEWTIAVARHYLIVQNIAMCLTEVDLSRPGVEPAAGGRPAVTGVSILPPFLPSHEGVHTPSRALNAALLLGMKVDGSYDFDKGDVSPTDLDLTNYQKALVYLSNDIEGYRVRFAAAVARQRGRMEFSAWMIAVIGAIATIFISIKSTVRHYQPGYVAVGILAIIFSALGTAAASVNSFYSPNEMYSRSERALLQLRQLHSDLNAYVVSKPKDEICGPDYPGANANAPSATEIRDPQRNSKIKQNSRGTDPRDDSRAKEIRDFRDRFNEILTGLGSAGTVENPVQQSSATPQ